MNNKETDWDEQGYWDSTFRYLKDLENDQLRVVTELRIEEYVKRFEDPIEAQSDVEEGLQLLKEGHLLSWTRLRGELTEIFAKDEEFELLFIEAAKSKGIQFEANIVHFS